MSTAGGSKSAPGKIGGLYIINMDGSNLRPVDPLHNAGKFAASPDGQTIAYGAGQNGLLFNWETGVELFDPRQFGMNSPKGQAIASPSWSPLGDKLAWFVSGFFNDQEMSGYGIFDLNAQTFTLVHPFNILGTDGFPPAASWSPDGEWLAVSASDSDPLAMGVG
jgi:Tol biopolymer transport system component